MKLKCEKNREVIDFAKFKRQAYGLVYLTFEAKVLMLYIDILI